WPSPAPRAQRPGLSGSVQPAPVLWRCRARRAPPIRCLARVDPLAQLAARPAKARSGLEAATRTDHFRAISAQNRLKSTPSRLPSALTGADIEGDMTR